MEASVLFVDDELSQTDVADVLIEQQIYDDQDLCNAQVGSVWTELRRRESWMRTGSAITFVEGFVQRTVDWPDVPAHAYCLVVSLGPKYSGWDDQAGPDYTTQGELFERITLEAAQAFFRDWKFTRTGWTRGAAKKLDEVVGDVAKAIGEDIGFLDKYGDESANEAGLDLVWHLPFADLRAGYPVYLAQCASGVDWKRKLKEPDVAIWTKVIDFKQVPASAFSLPFALSDSDFTKRCNQSGGLLLDRYRLLGPDRPEDEWVSPELRGDLIDWVTPHVDWLVAPVLA